MFKRATRLAAIVMAIAAAGCSGSDGAQGPQGPQGPQGDPGNPGVPGQDLVATAKPESCTVCHATSGDQHQAIYDRYTDASKFAVSLVDVSTVSSVTTVRFQVTKDGLPYVDPKLASIDQKRFYGVSYDSATRKYDALVTGSFGTPAPGSADGEYIVTAAALNRAIESTNSEFFMLIAEGALPTEGATTLYDDVVNIGQAFGNANGYVSSANVAGCEKCHGAPYRKEGYRMARVDGLPDFAACKACHYDTRNGGHQDWQRLADDPLGFATTNISSAQNTKYAYKASVMNDVHMSHAMEFAYPQSMANCVTCHEGKLATINDQANFTIATCRSCHPVTGPAAADIDAKRAPALLSIMPAANHSATLLGNLYANAATQPTCTGCHDGASAPTFAQIHPGYEKQIYNANGLRYSDVFTVTVDSAVLAGTTLTVHFTGTEVGGAAVDPLSVASITPQVLVGLYAYDTKDLIADQLSYTFGGTANPRFANATTTLSNASTIVWTVDVALGDWATALSSTVNRLEVALLPRLRNASGSVTYALNAPSKTFAVGTGTLATVPKNEIVDVAGCNKCHDALGTTFHSGNRGGNITVCRLCHNVRSGGSHLEMQSRSIDSYVHAIHRFQPFDIQNVDFSNPVEAMRYKHHTESNFPNFTIMNCRSCHTAGAFNPPANDKSLPGVLSAARVVAVRDAWVAGNSSSRNGPIFLPSMSPADSNIGAVPSVVTGPGSRACGSCHRAAKINENDGAALAAFNDHTEAMGFSIPAGTGVLDAAIAKLFALFK